MKKLLLTTAIVAVAGAAVAEVMWSGDAEVGYRTHFEYDTAKDQGYAQGDAAYDALATSAAGADIWVENMENITEMYYDAGLNAKASTDLGGGITASINYDLGLSDFNRTKNGVSSGNGGLTLDEGFPTLTVESPIVKGTIGEVAHVAEEWFAEPKGSVVAFAEDKDDLLGRLEGSYSGVNVGYSYVIADSDKGGADVDDWQIAAAGEFSGVVFALGYESQDNRNVVPDTEDDTIIGASAGYTFQGITGRLVYLSKTYADMGSLSGYNETTIGFTANYEMSNGVKLGAEYAMNSTDAKVTGRQGFDGFGLDKDNNDYDQYNSYKVFAGFEAMGADVELGYVNKNDVNSQFDNKTLELGNQGIYVDAAYEIEGTGVKVVGGYDETAAIVSYSSLADYNNAKPEDMWGGYYVGAYYGLGDNAEVFATYSNALELDPAETIKPGATLGMKVSF